MKILSWNINGIRASKVDLKKLFDSLDADVICLQETKVTRDMLDEPTAIIEGYNSYFSFSRKRSGYSGVANFCKNSVTPYKAEEGLSGILTQSEDGSLGHYGNHSSFTEEELKDLDAEGRAVITQHKIRSAEGKEEDLAIVNVYCPRFDPEREDRHLYKLRFYALLQTRAEALLDSGSHVVILGDINTTHKDLDVCDTGDEASLKKPSRLWLNHMMWAAGRDDTLEDVIDKEEFAAATPYTRGGMFIDTYRHLHPDQEGAFTNWCTLTNARSTNFGRRLDYILGNVDLVNACLKDALIMQHVEGSDHCPCKIELNCTPVPAKTCPPFCTKNMPEFQGKQQKLSNFFTKITRGDTVTKSDLTRADGDKQVIAKQTTDECLKKQNINKLHVTSNKRPTDNSTGTYPSVKRQKTDLKKSSSGAKQANLKSFFAKPQTIGIESQSNDDKVKCKYFIQKEKCVGESADNEKKADMVHNVNDTNTAGSVVLREEKSNDKSPSKTFALTKVSVEVVKDTTQQTASAWKNLLGGLGPAPLCKGHSEPCVLRTVKKAGPNKGKQFYTCARGEGLKSNPEARCDFFKWVDKKKK